MNNVIVKSLLVLTIALSAQAHAHGPNDGHDHAVYNRAKAHVAAGQINLIQNPVTDAEKVRTPAYVLYDMGKDVCNFHTNKLEDYDFIKDPVFNEFMYYHELGHCDFYFTGHFMKSKAANMMMEAEMLTFQEETYYTFLVLHEIYADAFAYAFMVKDGWSPKELEKILVWRAKGAWISNHKTDELLTKLQSIEWVGLGDDEIKVRVKAEIEPYFMENHVMKKFDYQVKDETMLQRSLRNEMGNFDTAVTPYIEGTIKYAPEANYMKLLTNMIKDGVNRPEAYPVFDMAAKRYQFLLQEKQAQQEQGVLEQILSKNDIGE